MSSLALAGLLALSALGCQSPSGQLVGEWDWNIPFQLHAKPLPDQLHTDQLHTDQLNADQPSADAPNAGQLTAYPQSTEVQPRVRDESAQSLPDPPDLDPQTVVNSDVGIAVPDLQKINDAKSEDLSKIIADMLQNDETDDASDTREQEDGADNPAAIEKQDAENQDSESASPAERPIQTGPNFRRMTLSLEDMRGMALASHPELIKQRAELNAVYGRHTQAGLPFNPTLQYQSEEIFNDDATGLHSLGISQQFVTANKLWLAQNVQSQAIQTQRAQLRTAELTIRTAVEIQFSKTLIAQRRLELNKGILQLAKNSVDSIESLLKAGEVSKVALLQAQVDAERAEVALEVAATQLSASRRALAASAAMQVLPDADLVGDLESDLSDEPWDELLQEILTINPELAAANSELCRAQRALTLAHAQVTPNVTGQFGLGLDTVTDDTFATIGVSVPLPIRNRNQGNIRTAQAKIASASATVRTTQFDLATRLAAAVSRYESARQRYQRLESKVIPLAKQSLDLSLNAFEAGETSYLELLTAQRSFFSTRLSSLDALDQARRALAEINGGLVTLR